MPDEKKVIKVLCKAYTGIRQQLNFERKESGYDPGEGANNIIELLDEMVEDYCQGTNEYR